MPVREIILNQMIFYSWKCLHIDSFKRATNTSKYLFRNKIGYRAD